MFRLSTKEKYWVTLPTITLHLCTQLRIALFAQWLLILLWDEQLRKLIAIVNLLQRSHPVLTWFIFNWDLNNRSGSVLQWQGSRWYRYFCAFGSLVLQFSSSLIVFNKVTWFCYLRVLFIPSAGKVLNTYQKLE